MEGARTVPASGAATRSSTHARTQSQGLSRDRHRRTAVSADQSRGCRPDILCALGIGARPLCRRETGYAATGHGITSGVGGTAGALPSERGLLRRSEWLLSAAQLLSPRCCVLRSASRVLPGAADLLPPTARVCSRDASVIRSAACLLRSTHALLLRWSGLRPSGLCCLSALVREAAARRPARPERVAGRRTLLPSSCVSES